MAEYIEREALLKKAIEERRFVFQMEDLLNNEVVFRTVYKDLAEFVLSVPAADVAPVVHGEWVVCGDGENVPWMCSHCGKTTAHKYKVMYGKFCPNCGARMDGE